MLRIAVYGKGGIGKSTTVSNLAAVLALRGMRVMQVGCDPKADSTFLLMHGRRIPTVLDRMRADVPPVLGDVVFEGFAGVLCAEAGGPPPGTGCAGRGVITAFEQLDELNAYERFAPDVVLYDVLGDVVCGGFSLPLRGAYTDVVYVVTSGEMMSLYAASNIGSALTRFKARGYARLGGLVLNRRNVEGERDLVRRLALEMDTRIAGDIPRSSAVHACEQASCTVVEGAPESDAARAYEALADTVTEAAGGVEQTKPGDAPADGACGVGGREDFHVR